MLKRTKYSRLRSDSVASLEDCPKRILSLKEDLCIDADFAVLGPGTPMHHGTSAVRNFIPRVANIRLQSPVSLHGLGGRAVSDGHSDRPLSCTGWDLGPNERLCSRPFSPGEPLSTHCALSCTKRPITLHRMAGLTQTHRCAPCMQHRDDVCCLKAAHAAEEQMANRVVHHDIKYVGSVEVMQSMRTLDFHTRMQVTREAISTLCERTSAKAAVKTKRPVCKGLSAILGRINLQFSGRRIILAVSTDSVTLIVAASLQKIAHHLMPAISFASGGDPDMGDYIAYVAKDLFNQRACHILECPRGKAREVIDSIGQAFDRRFRQLLSQTPSLLSSSARSAVRLCHKRLPEERSRSQRSEQEGEARKLCDYYNVIPGMTPPTGETEHLQVPDKPDADTQRISLYENCSTTDGRIVLPPAGSVEPEISAEQCPQTGIQDLIQREGWFHGRLGREQAESLLTCSGDFLVRESSSASGQYVLSGMEGGTVRHLLLVDAHGQVRTHDQVFLSIGHLVRFHMENQLPIVSGSSELFLKQPILQH